MVIKNFLIPIMITSILLLTGCTNYDSFAKCLTEKDVKMYGAYWCPHCAAQKDRFGNSFQYIDYIECSLPNKGGQNQICNEANIKLYPTWEFEDGTRREGEMELEQLSQLSGCSLEVE